MDMEVRRERHAKRRGHGEGASYQPSRDGRWCGVLDSGREPDGKRRRWTVRANTQQEILRKVRAFQRDTFRWSVVDRDSGALAVREKVRRHKGKLASREPNSERAQRTIVRPALVVGPLRSHRAAQHRQRLAGPTWTNGHVLITTLIGTVLDRRNLWRRWEAIRHALGIDPDTRFHDLSHLAGSLALLPGIPLRAVADLFGHYQTSVPASTHSHILDNTKRETAARLDTALTTIEADSNRSHHGGTT